MEQGLAIGAEIILVSAQVKNCLQKFPDFWFVQLLPMLSQHMKSLQPSNVNLQRASRFRTAELHDLLRDRLSSLIWFQPLNLATNLLLDLLSQSLKPHRV